ncbi:sigma-70 family RNA polymerase sigma factor [Amaricoccus solimangrovi]|uniref:RNA polymerase sigma factor n=1 Tax=Amaricoccus solimangrovi TaxID=2589815 RepID=A0A501WZY4_9RHOB|nr:sigma-70 family RNA polymerase sigma factor [Amaricoccus solimangrovi]
MVELIPALRAFARSLARDPTEADDLVQETLMKAIANTDKFQPGTRLRSWLFTIMRNSFSTRCVKANRERPGGADCVSALPWTEATQHWSSELREVMTAIRTLPRAQREVLVLVAMLGIEYDEAARICDCPIGTIKSRLNRAREQLRLALEPPAGNRGPRS